MLEAALLHNMIMHKSSSPELLDRPFATQSNGWSLECRLMGKKSAGMWERDWKGVKSSEELMGSTRAGPLKKSIDAY